MYESMKFNATKSFTEIIKIMADELESISIALDKKFKTWNGAGAVLIQMNFFSRIPNSDSYKVKAPQGLLVALCDGWKASARI